MTVTTKQVRATLAINTSVLIEQNEAVSEVIKALMPRLLEHFTEQVVSEILYSFILKLKNLIIGHSVTTVAADGSRKIIRTLRYRGNIKLFATTFLTNKINCNH